MSTLGATSASAAGWPGRAMMGGRCPAEQMRMWPRDGLTIAQSAESCVVFGMPKAAIERGHAARVLSLDALANTLQAQCGVLHAAPAGNIVPLPAL